MKLRGFVSCRTHLSRQCQNIHRNLSNATIKKDVVIIGGGHNGLVAAAYLAKTGFDTILIERRHLLGGCAVTESLFGGYKISRASYLAGLLRPHIIKDLDLHSKYNFKYLPRDPSSFTPTKLDSVYGGKYLMLGSNDDENHKSISQFSSKDADAYIEYESFLNRVRDMMQPLLDHPPFDLTLSGHVYEKLRAVHKTSQFVSKAWKHRDILVPFYELFTGPAQQLLDRWFESEILKTTLATDAVIGASISPKHNGSAYVLLHHVMGEAAGRQGVWAYVEGGMGGISQSIAAAAKDFGADLVVDNTVNQILLDNKGAVRGVRLNDGTEIESETVISAASPYTTFTNLLSKEDINTGNDKLKKFVKHIKHIDYACGAFKINCIVNKLPNFSCAPSPADGQPGPMHRGTVHFESHMSEIEAAYTEAAQGIPATRPVIEMTIPSALDPSLIPEGSTNHVVQFFIQYAPYDLKTGLSWADAAFKENFVQRCFKIVDEFCPGFSSSVLHVDALSPLDLEQVFGLYKGNISHGALSLHQLGYTRPVSGYSNYKTPINGLYLCSAGTHPGGGVMGAAGYNCAQIVISDKLGYRILLPF